MQRRTRRLVVGFAVGVAAVGGGLAAAVAGGILFHDTAVPASIQEALRRFRALDPQPSGAEGVYVFDTRGGETLNALGGARHAYPAQTALTLIRSACGVSEEWTALEGRSTTWTLCGASLDLRVSSEVHRFYGRTDRTTYACSGSVLRAPATRHFRCRSHEGVETGRVVVVSTRPLHVRTIGRIRGGDQGTETVDWWFGPASPVPLRIDLSSRTSRHVFVGRVHYRENADLRLRSATPRR
jgi:hypothetical protein